MANIVGITGGMSGKMGSAIFRQRNGKTIVSQYQPVVKNPNTEGQQEQRASFKLMSQLAAIMEPALVGFSMSGKRGSVLTQRNAFVKTNFPLVSVATIDGSTEASIPMEALQLTGSSEALGSLSLQPNQVVSGIDVTVEIPQRYTSEGGKKTKIVLVGFGTMGTVDRPARARVVEIVDVPLSEGTTNVFSHTFSTLQPGKYTVLAYGMFETSKGATRVDYDNIHTPLEDGYISRVVIDEYIADGSMMLTETLGGNIEVQP